MYLSRGIEEMDEPRRQSVDGLQNAQLVSTSKIRGATQSSPEPTEMAGKDDQKKVRDSVAMLANSKLVSKAREDRSGLSTLGDLRAAIAEVDGKEASGSQQNSEANTPAVTPGAEGAASSPAGLGLRFRPSSQGIRILNVAEGGPAHKSGLLREGDVIISVEGVIVKGMDNDNVVQLLSGTHGSICKMVKLDAGSEPKHLELVRETFVRALSS